MPSGALRVRVFAGRDRVTRKRLVLTETFAADTPDLLNVAVAAQDRLLDDVEAQRYPQTNATVLMLVQRYLSKWAGSESFLMTLEGYVRNHIAPLKFAHEKARTVDGDMLDSFYAELARCSKHCTGAPLIEHRTKRLHVCDNRCRKHRCQGLSATTIRHIHHLLSGAYKKGKKWKWVRDNPTKDADPPAAPPSKPKPPKPPEAARILNAAWQADEDWGTQIWLHMTTGERRGEICALRFNDFDLSWDEDGDLASADGTVQVERAITKTKSGWVEGPTKDHQQRRIVLDPETVAILREYRRRCELRAARAGFELAEDAFVFSPAADRRTFYKPDSITQRYGRLVTRLGIITSIHKLRHYSATELILGGVDIRTVAGRLGHGGGGTTTLKVYAAFVSEADQRAATTLHSRMPARPVLASPPERAASEPRGPYETIAATIRQEWSSGQVAEGDRVPPIKHLAEIHGVSVGTAHRAVELLRTWNVINGGGRGRPLLYLAPPAAPESTADPVTDAAVPEPRPSAEELDLEIICLGQSRKTIRTMADPTDTPNMLRLLSAAVRRAGGRPEDIEDYEMVVRYAGERGVVTTFVPPPFSASPHAIAEGRLHHAS